MIRTSFKVLAEQGGITMTTTAIHASHIIVYDGHEHRHLRDGFVVYEDNTIRHVGRTYDGPVDHTIDATGKLVTPGLINTHAHLAGSPLDKSFIEDRGNPQFYMSGLFEFLPARGGAMTSEDAQACIDFSIVELLRSGTTTILEMGGQSEYMAERAGEMGMRAYIGPMYRDGRWYTPDGRQVCYDWDEAAGRDSFRQVVAFIETHNSTYNDRIRGFLSPSQVDTCSAELLQETHSLAEQLDVPVQIYVSQSVNEFQTMLQRHGKTPLAWLRDIGVLSPRVLLGHAISVGTCHYYWWHKLDQLPGWRSQHYCRRRLPGDSCAMGVCSSRHRYGILSALSRRGHYDDIGKRHQSAKYHSGHAVGRRHL